MLIHKCLLQGKSMMRQSSCGYSIGQKACKFVAFSSYPWSIPSSRRELSLYFLTCKLGKSALLCMPFDVSCKVCLITNGFCIIRNFGDPPQDSKNSLKNIFIHFLELFDKMRWMLVCRFYHGYDNYIAHAFPHDDLRPLSRSYTDSLGERVTRS